MSYVQQVRVGGAAVKGLYRKHATEGDAYRFTTADSGSIQLINTTDTTILDDGRARVSAGGASPGLTWKDFVLNFPYLVGVKQIEVSIVANLNALMQRIPNKVDMEMARASWQPGWPPALLNPASAAFCYFDEISYDTVRVFNIPTGFSVVHFSIPATSLQGAVKERVQIKNQSDNIGLELLGNGNGIVLRSERGKRALLRIDDELGLGLDPI
jgi:hypothetical protein